MKTMIRIFSKHYLFFASLVLLFFVVFGCDQEGSDSNWQKALAGKKLERAQTSGSFSDSFLIWFCSTGEYVIKTQTSGLSTGGDGTLSTTNEDVEYGRWSVNSSTLNFQTNDGSKYEFQLSEGTGGNVIKLNGTGFLVTSHNYSCSEN